MRLTPPTLRAMRAARVRRQRLSLCTVAAAAPMIALAPTSAAAQIPWNALPVTGLYIGAGAGVNWVQNTDLDQSGNLTAGLRAAGFPAAGGKARFDTGFALLANAGWGFGNGLRMEGEFSYRQNDIYSIGGFGRLSPFRNAGGTQRTYALMANLLYDFNIRTVPWVVPYLGVGLGIAWTEWDGVGALASGGLLRLTANSTEYNFAFQGIAGVAFPILSVPGLAITTEYRFFGTLQNKFEARVRNAATNVVVARGSVEADNYNHALIVGVRYNFGRTPPPPPIAPAVVPAPTRTYLVFFDWDRADLTDRARAIIADAAQNRTRVQVTRIEVNGYTDRSGSAQYNQGLSVRRANAVAAELVRLGVPRNEIVTRGFGEENPLVPTADGVREPQNRRVEIILR